jgi:Zn-dependent protease
VTDAEMFLNWPPSWSILLYLPALFLGFTVHEVAHATVAYLLGDTSQVERRRLSFNPVRHVSWLGMVVFLLFGFGWAKPVQVDPTRFRIKNRAGGMFLVSIAGASANLLMVLLAFLGIAATGVLVSWLTGTGLWDVYRFLMVEEPALDLQGLAAALSVYVLNVNLILAIFNLLPFPPLDGFQALMSLYSVGRRALTGKPAYQSAMRPPPIAASGEATVRSPAEIHFDIGLEYQKKGQLDEAIARYRQALANDEQFALAYYNLGLAHWAKGQLPLATGAFRSALHSSRDVAVRIQADLRLREVAQDEQDPEGKIGPLPSPLERGTPVDLPPKEAAGSSVPLDPAVARRVWLRLAIGGVVMAALAVAAWLFVTVVAFLSVT